MTTPADTPASVPATPAPAHITYDDFRKVELKVAKVLAAEEVPGADKLLKLKVTLGTGERQLVAGIKKQYAPADLVGKEVVIVVNLAPRMIMGVESQGMVLAATDAAGAPVILRPDKEVGAGASIK